MDNEKCGTNLKIKFNFRHISYFFILLYQGLNCTNLIYELCEHKLTILKTHS